ncbi:Transmembrane protein 19 [Aphanomyces cochlioides]|nr:Transmembrane protein 19 [Aphanomyces cochlioides]
MAWQVVVRVVVAIAISVLAALHGLRKRSLSRGGALAAFCVGSVSMGCGYRFGILLLLFYFTSSKLTHYREDQKAKMDASTKEGGQRSAIQVLSVSLIACGLAITYVSQVGEDRPIDGTPLPTMLWGAYIAHYACCAADTWASELGVLSKSSPILITRCKTVPPGTNGGISLLGTAAAAAGGTFIGVLFYLYDLLFLPAVTSTPQWPAVFFGLASGLIGCMLDSILGATLQSTFYCTRTNRIVPQPHIPSADVVLISGYDILTNEQVNVVSVALTTLLGAYIAPAFF